VQKARQATATFKKPSLGKGFCLSLSIFIMGVSGQYIVYIVFTLDIIHNILYKSASRSLRVGAAVGLQRGAQRIIS
jgi:hypothetical protein